MNDQKFEFEGLQCKKLCELTASGWRYDVFDFRMPCPLRLTTLLQTQTSLRAKPTSETTKNVGASIVPREAIRRGTCVRFFYDYEGISGSIGILFTNTLRMARHSHAHLVTIILESKRIQ